MAGSRSAPTARAARRPATLVVRAALLIAVLAPLSSLVTAGGGCVKVGDGLGQSCLTDEDCFSGYCAEQTCVAAPVLFDAEPQGDAQGTDDGSPVVAEGGEAGPLDSGGGTGDGAADTGAPGDASPGADASPADGAAEANPPEASTDALTEASTDAPADVGGGG